MKVAYITLVQIESAREAVVDAAVAYCRDTQADYAEVIGSGSMDIPVLFMALHEAVAEAEKLQHWYDQEAGTRERQRKIK